MPCQFLHFYTPCQFLHIYTPCHFPNIYMPFQLMLIIITAENTPESGCNLVMYGRCISEAQLYPLRS
jgi:hypothetical protein